MKSSGWRLRGYCLAAVLVLLAACHSPLPPLRHDVYVWQRAWTPAVHEAMQASAGAIAQWRVLAAESGRSGRLRAIGADRAALRASGKPVVLVVRIDGQLPQGNERQLRDDTLAVWRDWQGSGVRLAGMEIDHDCGTARLPAYAQFLADLHAQLGPQTMLSITALPAWMASPALDRVLAQVDQSVLQVHAVSNPREGLFDAAQARRWAAEYAKRSDKPFLVALPDYGSRVSWDAQGRLSSVASEAAVLDARDDARELLAMPAQVAGLLRQWRDGRPSNLVGIAWFRLPTSQDRRAWSLPTWLAVLRGQPLSPRLVAASRASGTPGAPNIRLENLGRTDAPLPSRIRLPSACTLADGVNGYRLQRQADSLWLQRLQPGLLHPGELRNVGWARCAIEGESLHVEE